MTTKAPLTAVIFRKWKPKHGGSVLAIFPALPSDARGKYCEMYEHVGQHSGGDYNIVMARTTPATPADYRALKRELESAPYSYRFHVYKKRTQQHRTEHALTLRTWLTRNQDSAVTKVRDGH
jgi:hypothetical protein